MRPPAPHLSSLGRTARTLPRLYGVGRPLLCRRHGLADGAHAGLHGGGGGAGVRCAGVGARARASTTCSTCKTKQTCSIEKQGSKEAMKQVSKLTDIYKGIGFFFWLHYWNVQVKPCIGFFF